MGAFHFWRLSFLASAGAAMMIAAGCAAPAKSSKSAAKPVHSKAVADNFPDAATAGLLPPPTQHKQ